MNELVKIVNESGLDQTKAQVLLEKFSNYFEIASDWESKTKALIVTSSKQKAEMAMARQGRLFLKEKRVEVERTRKTLKENSLREGQTIDAIAKILTNLITPIEKDLEEKEKFVEIQEEKRRAALKEYREQEIEPLREFIPMGLDFGKIDDDSYAKILSDAKLQMQAKIDEEKRRIEQEKAEAAEHERIRKENERMKKEAEEKEREMAAERAKAEAARKAIEEKARKEREETERKIAAEREAARKAAEKAADERARLEAEIRAKKEAEEKERKAKEAAEKKAMNAPDKTKLIALALMIEKLPIPEVRGEEANSILLNTEMLLKKVVSFIREKSSNL